MAARAHPRRDAGGDLHGAVDYRHRTAVRASTASSATAGTSASCARCWFWRQSNRLVRRRERSGRRRERRDPAFTCAKMFWWYNMYSSVDWSVTPRPDLSRRRPEDSRHLQPARRACVNELQALSSAPFPLFQFWGPEADDRVDAVDRATSAKLVESVDCSDAAARLPAAPRLRPSAVRPEPSRDS